MASPPRRVAAMVLVALATLLSPRAVSAQTFGVELHNNLNQGTLGSELY